MTAQVRRGRALVFAAWTGIAALVTLALWLARDQVSVAQMALAFLLVVLVGSARGGRAVGVFLAIFCFLVFNFFLLPPYYTFHLTEALDWWVLIAFLVTAGVAAQLLHGEQVAALREADRLKDALLASVSHDLRTPLTSIKALAAELRVAGDERGALIEEEADRLNRFVTDLLDLSRLTGGALPLSPEVIAAEDLVGAALQRLAGVPAAAAIQVSLPADGSLPLGRFDFVHSLRALTNLLDNALRFSPEPGSVGLVVRTEGAFLVLEVTDRGPGIPEADRHRLFEPFAAAREGRGTGLGLSIASRIAEAQGGSVTHEPRPGGGSRFTLRLPAATLDAAS